MCLKLRQTRTCEVQLLRGLVPLTVDEVSWFEGAPNLCMWQFPFVHDLFESRDEHFPFGDGGEVVVIKVLDFHVMHLRRRDFQSEVAVFTSVDSRAFSLPPFFVDVRTYWCAALFSLKFL